jgi:hypothetical protein
MIMPLETPPVLPPVSVRQPRYRAISILLGVLLLAAALLKVNGLATDPVGRIGVFGSAEFQVAVIEFELFLAAWLLTGLAPMGSWLVAFATFSGFAAVSAYQGWIGQSSCGCFGRLSVSPWYALSIDIIILAGLLIARPDFRPLRTNPLASLRLAALPAAVFTTLLVLIVTIGVGVANLGFGSTGSAIAYFRGERVSVSPRVVDVGRTPRGESRRTSITLSNWTERPVRFFGGTADCSCTVLHDLPITIPPGESRTVEVEVKLTGPPGLFTRHAAFLVEDEGLRRLDFRLTGQILEAQSPPN